MALLTLNFESQYLGNNHTVGVILPDKPHGMSPDAFYGSGKRYKVLWLLHGTFGDYSDWLRKTRIELYACERDLIVVMPSGMNSNYANWPSFGTGFHMYDYFFQELMPLIYNWFPASDKREDNYIAGLSMGGRGTCVMAMNHPKKFAGACVLSSFPTDLWEIKQTNSPLWNRMKKATINFETEEEFLNSYQNSWKVLENNVLQGKQMPKLLFGCGEDDPFYPGFLKFKEKADGIGLKADYFSVPNYKHEWRFWDLGIERALDYFEIPKKEEDDEIPFLKKK